MAGHIHWTGEKTMTEATKKKVIVTGVDLPWHKLNALLLTITDPDDAEKLLNEEKARSVPRSARIVRLHSRFNRLRGLREKGML
jgi:hypothetical protein